MFIYIINCVSCIFKLLFGTDVSNNFTGLVIDKKSNRSLFDDVLSIDWLFPDFELFIGDSSIIILFIDETPTDKLLVELDGLTGATPYQIKNIFY